MDVQKQIETLKSYLHNPDIVLNIFFAVSIISTLVLPYLPEKISKAFHTDEFRIVSIILITGLYYIETKSFTKSPVVGLIILVLFVSTQVSGSPIHENFRGRLENESDEPLVIPDDYYKSGVDDLRGVPSDSPLATPNEYLILDEQQQRDNMNNQMVSGEPIIIEEEVSGYSGEELAIF